MGADPSPAGPAPPAAPRAARESLVAAARLLVIPVGAFAVSRVMVLAAQGLATWLHPELTLGGVINGWDGGWYLGIAVHGYPRTLAQVRGGIGSAWAFFPALPAVLRGVIDVTRISTTRAGELVGIGLGLTGVLSVWLAVRQAFGTAAADRTAVLLSFFPGAFVLSMPYSEGLFLTAAALCLYAVGRRNWLAAGLLASLASLTRAPGVALVLVCFVIAGREMVARRSWRPLLAAGTAPLGFALWCWYQWHAVGTPFAFLKAEGYWSQGPQWFGECFRNLWDLLTLPHAWVEANEVIGGLTALFITIALGLMGWRQARQRDIPLSWWLYTGVIVLSVLTTYQGGSDPRLIMVGFPLLAVTAMALPRRADAMAVAGLGMLQSGLAVVVLTTLINLPTPRYGLFNP